MFANQHYIGKVVFRGHMGWIGYTREQVFIKAYKTWHTQFGITALVASSRRDLRSRTARPFKDLPEIIVGYNINIIFGQQEKISSEMKW